MKKLIGVGVGVGVAVLVSLSLVATAFAAGLPTFRSDLIVPNQSLAGVKLKSTYSEAVKAFKSGARGCSITRGCSYRAADGATFSVLFARLTTKGTPFVAEISVQAGDKLAGTKETGVFTTPLAALKTANGIGLGSTAAEVKRAYPRATGNPVEGFTIKGHGEYGTSFHLLDGRVTLIQMEGADVG
jgi:hypothetical protein